MMMYLKCIETVIDPAEEFGSNKAMDSFIKGDVYEIQSSFHTSGSYKTFIDMGSFICKIYFKEITEKQFCKEIDKKYLKENK